MEHNELVLPYNIADLTAVCQELRDHLSTLARYHAPSPIPAIKGAQISLCYAQNDADAIDSVELGNGEHTITIAYNQGSTPVLSLDGELLAELVEGELLTALYEKLEDRSKEAERMINDFDQTHQAAAVEQQKVETRNRIDAVNTF